MTRSGNPRLPFGALPGFFSLGLVSAAATVSLAGSMASVGADTPGAALGAEELPAATVPAMRGTAPPVLPGWPQSMGINGSFPPVGVVLADLDGDDDLEVVAGSTNNTLYAWDHGGVPLAGFPINVGGQIQSKAAVADLDEDGDLEILVAVKSGQLHIYHHDGTALVGWPQATGFTYGNLAPSVYNLDLEGPPEVLIGGGGNVRAWFADGTSVPGWPQAVAGNITGTLAIGDLAGDESPEIFAVSSSKDLFGFQADGTVLPGFPIAFGLSSSWAAPSIGDLDGDGSREVCVVGYDFGVSSQIFAYNGDGSTVPGFPVSHSSGQTYSCPVLADIDGDGDLELFNAGKITGDSFYAWDHTGTVLPGWPVATGANMEGSAIVADFDGSPEGQVAIGDNSGPGSIFGFEVTGAGAAGFPVPKPGISYPNSPSVGDVDNDGDLDMAMTTGDGSVTIWDFSVPFAVDRVEWGTHYHDNWNTNQHGFVVPSPDVAGAPALGALEFLAAEPNPMGSAGTIVRWALSDGDALVRAGIHDATGRQIRTLAVGSAAGQLRWDGTDDSGRAMPTGVYFLRFETERGGDSVPVTIVR